MFGAIKSLPIQTKPAVSTLFANFVGKASPVIGTVRFQQASAGHDHNMEKNQQADQKKKQQDKEQG